MTNNNIVKSQYFNWLCAIAIPDNNLRENYTALLGYLYEKIYIPRFEMDLNRAQDGVNLRFKFEREYDYAIEDIIEYFDNEPCSMLEMMIALSIKLEESIMFDPDKGDRISLWFMNMLRNMEISDSTNNMFHYKRVDLVVSLFLDGQYGADGSGSLFKIKRKDIDMRDYDLWYQMNFYAEELDKLERTIGF